MDFNISNFIDIRSRKSKIGDFQDLDHIDGLSISTTSANLYNKKRDDLVLFYFRNGASHASVYTQSKIVSENIKWNLNIKSKKIKALLINTRNANALTGKNGYKSLKFLAEELSKKLSEKQKIDETSPDKVKPSDILFACTGTIGEQFPTEKINSSIPELVEKIKYTQNKYIWMKAAMGILTTDLKPKLAMEECYIGKKQIKIYGLAKGSGMIFPNMGTMLSYIFIEANLSKGILKKILHSNLDSSFNSISVDGDTSTSDTLMLFSLSDRDQKKN